MKRDEIYAELSKCKTLPELVGKASAMKRDGEKETVVNKIVTELRKKLMTTSNRLTTIKRVSLPVREAEQYGYLMVYPQDINAPKVYYDGEGILI